MASEVLAVEVGGVGHGQGVLVVVRLLRVYIHHVIVLHGVAM